LANLLLQANPVNKRQKRHDHLREQHTVGGTLAPAETTHQHRHDTRKHADHRLIARRCGRISAVGEQKRRKQQPARQQRVQGCSPDQPGKQPHRSEHTRGCDKPHAAAKNEEHPTEQDHCGTGLSDRARVNPKQ
jgi:hypothetical protein